MSAIDYLNRKFDVLSFNGVQLHGQQPLQQSLFSFGDSGSVCTGVQKLAQRWLLEFLTEQGSMGFHLSTRGSSFMTWVRQGRLRSEFDVQTFFNFAELQVQTNLQAEETSDQPDEERFDSATLSQILLMDDDIGLVVLIRSRAGDTREIILPINITPVNMQV